MIVLLRSNHNYRKGAEDIKRVISFVCFTVKDGYKINLEHTHNSIHRK